MRILRRTDDAWSRSLGVFVGLTPAFSGGPGGAPFASEGSIEHSKIPDHNHIAEEPRFGLAESHAAAVKHTVIRIENAMGRIKRYVELTTVMAAKESARAHPVVRMTAKVSAGRLPSCHANTAANR